MCRFCIEHGDGKKWYLEAKNYAADLSSDLNRRGYMIGFLQEFDTNRRRLLTGMELLEATPRPVGNLAKRAFTRGLMGSHFGQPVPIEECALIFDIATSIVNIPCPCRVFAGGREEGYCLMVTTSPVSSMLAEAFAGYAHGPDVSAFQQLSKAEALSLLRQCETQGLMHSVWTFLTPFIGAICNCNLESGCMAMRLTIGHGAKLMWKGESVAAVDATKCNSCGACVKLCPFNAIDMEKGRGASVRPGDCWGCGICRSGCATPALALSDRASSPGAAGLW